MANMTTMNISLTGPMKDYIQSQVDSGKFANSSDFVRDLVRQDQIRKEKLLTLQSAITKGINSGVSTRKIGNVFDEAMRLAKKQ